MKSIYTPFVYYLKWTKTNKKYIGSRWATERSCVYETGCHPDDLWNTYFTSSKHVERYRNKHGDPDVIEIRATFKTDVEAQKYEETLLRKLKAVSRKDYLNHNYGIPRKQRKGNEHPLKGVSRPQEVRDKIREGNTGKVLTKEHKLKISKSHIGKTLSEEHKLNISKGITEEIKEKSRKWNKENNTGKKQSEETIEKRAKKLRGKKKNISEEGAAKRLKSLKEIPRNTKAVEYNGKVYKTKKECALANNIGQGKLNTLIKKGIAKLA
jgi:hypothetical protein